MSPRKILIFSTAYFPFVGGAEVAIKEITNRLGNDFEFDLITARLKGGLEDVEKIGAVTVYRIGIGVRLLDKFFLPYLGAWKAWQLHKRNHYICFWGMMATYATGAAYIVNFFKKVPIVLTLQEGDSEQYLRTKWLGLIDLSWRLALKRTDHLTGISTYLLERARCLGYRGHAVLIPNGVDVKKFESASHAVMNGEKVTLITTSRLVEKNAVGDIIEALKFLPENVVLRILGIGPLEESLKHKVKSLHLTDRVQFLGHVPYEEIPNHLREADLFIRPSLSEGMGNSFIEAMAAGLPVIATPVGGIPDFLKDGETGLFVEPKSPRLVAFQVQKLVSDRVLRDKIIINAKRMVAEKYDWDLVSREMKGRVFDMV